MSTLSNDVFAVTEIGLVFRKNPNLQEWLAMGENLALYHHSIPWLVGDWLNHGEKREWGEQYTQALDQTKFSLSTLKIYKHVCARFPMEKRVEQLTFSHHSEVAPCDDEDAKEWLAKAVEHGWSVGQLRRAMNGESEEQVDDNPVSSPTSIVDRMKREFLRMEIEEMEEFLEWAKKEFREQKKRKQAEEKAKAEAKKL